MKTTAIIFAAALLFGFSSCQKETIAPENATPAIEKTTVASADDAIQPETILVRYAVNIHIEKEMSYCNTYFVEMLNASGERVAPAQVYVPGTTVYYFSEMTRQTKGIRIAHLDISSGPNYQCESNLYARPDIQKLEFENEASYEFNLYPTNDPPKPE